MEDELFISYHDSICMGKLQTKNFLIEHARQICSIHGFSVFKQFMLNYRICFESDNKDRIYKDFRKYVLEKSSQHNSDLAMSYQIIITVKPHKDMEIEIVNFMFDRLKHTFLKKYQHLNVPYEIKKRLTLETIYNKILIRKTN